MKVTRNIKEKLIIELDSKKNSRGDIKDYFNNFIRNFSKSYALFLFVKEKSEDEEVQKTALAQHIVSLISICETFFRDIFTFIVTIDSQFKEEIITSYNLRIKSSVPDIQVNIEDVLCEFFNFQNIDDIELAFKPMIIGDNFFDDIGNIVLPFYNHKEDTIQKFCLNVSIADWKDLFDGIIRERHNITHDANYSIQLNINHFERYQKIILYFPQVFSLWISSKYKLPYIVLHIGDKGDIPFICKLEDLLSEWEEVKE